ncbi:MAG: DUF1858 domain-containing protein [Candidatus Diapherotrites archaeon]
MGVITKEMSIMDIVSKFPETVEVFMRHGLHCVGCAAARFENLEQGAIAHGIDADVLVKDLNKAVQTHAETSDDGADDGE